LPAAPVIIATAVFEFMAAKANTVRAGELDSPASPTRSPAMPAVVLTERKGFVHWITINRPDRRNALNEEVVRTIHGALAEAVEDRECRAVVLTGAGDQAFCAGADLQKNAQGGAFDVDFSRPQHYVVDLFKRIQGCPLPLIARRQRPRHGRWFSACSAPATWRSPPTTSASARRSRGLA